MNTAQKMIEENKKIQQFLSVLRLRDKIAISHNKKVPVGNGEFVEMNSIIPMAKNAILSSHIQLLEEIREIAQVAVMAAEKYDKVGRIMATEYILTSIDEKLEEYKSLLTKGE